MNTHGYVGGNPLKYIDPKGQIFFLIPGIPAAVAALADLAFYGSIAWGLHNSNNVEVGPWPGSTDDPDADTTISDILDEITGDRLNPPKEDTNSNPDICPAPDCKKVTDECIQECSNLLDIGDNGVKFRRCVASCKKKNGC